MRRRIAGTSGPNPNPNPNPIWRRRIAGTSGTAPSTRPRRTTARPLPLYEGRQALRALPGALRGLPGALRGLPGALATASSGCRHLAMNGARRQLPSGRDTRAQSKPPGAAINCSYSNTHTHARTHARARPERARSQHAWLTARNPRPAPQGGPVVTRAPPRALQAQRRGSIPHHRCPS